MGHDAAFGAIKHRPMLGRDSAKAARDKLDPNVLVAQIMEGAAIRACLRQHDGARGLALWAA